MKSLSQDYISTSQSKLWLGALLVGLVTLAAGSIAYAAPSADSQLTQEIGAGTLSTDIRNSSGTVVTDPAFAMSSVNISNSQQVSTGTFGSDSQRISVDNPGGADGGWTLALAATNVDNKWESGSDSYDYKGTAAQGQLSIDPAAGTITPIAGTSTGITKGSSSAFSGAGSAVTLMQAGASADKIWNGYLTGVGLSQTIPASQAGGSYSIDMTQTVTAS